MKLLNKYLTENFAASDTKQMMQQFNQYYETLIEVNAHTNLTAITEKSQVESKHFIDSLLGNKYINGEVLDVGAGAGFPTIPLAIVNKQSSFTLVDSVNKKVEFINIIKNELNIQNITAIHSRAEDLDKSHKYDCVVARGVGALNIIIEYCLPFLKVGGQMIAYKSIKSDEEIKNAQNALSILGGKVEKIEDFKLQTQSGEVLERKLIIIKKISNLNDSKYPRSANKPRKQPL